MNRLPVFQPHSANGFGRRKIEKEAGTRVDNKSMTGKGMLAGGTARGNGSPSQERLVYMTTCLIGHPVEVQVIDGSIFSGIFHATNAAKDFGIVLKMARLIKIGSSGGQKNILDSVNRPPSKTMIIPARELVQVMAKGVSVTMDGLANELQYEKQQEIMTDTSISQSRHVGVERELERWVPADDDPECPELDNIFDGPWNRSWDQFEANEALFGVKSTFNEDLYTTKLDRGPQMRELETEALRLAREIEGEDTQDLHLAEERGIQIQGDIEMDEEARFSSVFRGADYSASGEKQNLLDLQNIESFAYVSDSFVSKSFTDFMCGKSKVGGEAPSSSSSKDAVDSSQSITGNEMYSSVSDNDRQFSSDCIPGTVLAFGGGSRVQENRFSDKLADFTKERAETQNLAEEAQASKPELPNSDKGGLSPNATAYAPTSSMSHGNNFRSESLENTSSAREHGTMQSKITRARPGSSTLSTSECGNVVPASSVIQLSPSSSMGSLSSDRSTLNPHAKEFKLNPNAKSYTPTQTSLRPASPVSDGSTYYSTNLHTVSHIHGMPLGIGVGPSLAGHQQVAFHEQAVPMQSPQSYYHSNGPQYGQQMLLGQPRQVFYMPSYPQKCTLKDESLANVALDGAMLSKKHKK